METLLFLSVLGFGLVGAAGVALHLRLVALATEARTAWTGLDVALRTRWGAVRDAVDRARLLVPDARDVLDDVAGARRAAMRVTGGAAARAKAEARLDAALARLHALAVERPELMADAEFRSLGGQLASLAAAIASHSALFDAAVERMNAAQRRGLYRLIARRAGHAPGEHFR